MLIFLSVSIFGSFSAPPAIARGGQARDSAQLKNFFNAMAGFFGGDPNKVDENGFTRLQRAILKNDLGKAVALIKAGADVNYRGSMIYPPLHLALDQDRHGIALALIQAGADIDLKDTQGRTPLHHAARQNQDNFIGMLLKLGANPNIKDDDGKTPLHTLGTSRPTLVDLLVSYKADVNARDDEGKTPLHHFLDKSMMIDRLLQNKADPNIADNTGRTPYTSLLDETKIEKAALTLRTMLLAGADINAKGDKGETLLHLAARLQHSDLFSSTIHRADLTVKAPAGNNVLHLLAPSQNSLMISRVLDRAPELLKEKNAAGLTPLGAVCDAVYGRHWATLSHGVESTIRIMIIRGADPNAQDRNGHTLLHFAVQSGRTELAEYLLSRKIDPDIRNIKGTTALHIAVEKKDMDMLDLLLDRGADPDLTDDRGWTVLDRLAEKGDRQSPVVQRLIVAGGQYQKQLPLNPELVRPRAGTPPAAPADDAPKTLDKPRAPTKVLRLPSARDQFADKPPTNPPANGNDAKPPKRGSDTPKP